MMVMLLLILTILSCSLTPEVQGQSSGSIRLVGENGALSSGLTAGRVEVYYNGQWGTVCDDSFGASEARVACRQLGFSGYITYGSVSSRFDAASTSTRTWLDNLSCSGSELILGQCTHNGIGIENCQHSEDVYVSCLGDGALRLVDSFGLSTITSAGRLEVYYNGQWGTVCDDSFGQTDAEVACRQLGYESVSNYGQVSSLGYSQGSGRIWLDNLRCTSSDIMLSTCTHDGFGNTAGCFHSEDVAVSCSIDITGIVTSLSSGIIAGIVIAVLAPIICIIVCVVIICVVVCTGACCAAGASNRSRRGNAQITTSAQSTAATATIVKTTGTAAQAPPPPYSAQAYPGQPQVAQYPPQGQAYPQAYPVQAAPYPPTAEGQGYLPPQPYPGSEYPGQAQAPPQPYPDQPPQAPEKVDHEMQQYPASDPAYPPPGTAPYPTGDPNQPLLN